MSTIKLKRIKQAVDTGVTQPLSIGGVASDNSDEVMNIASNGDLQIKKIIQTNGIKFPATQVPSADPNTLDDYEEGTWTPAISNTTNGTKTHSTQSGSYIKIGKLVFCKFHIVLSSNVGSSGATNIVGLPFNSTGIASVSLSLIEGITMPSGYTVGITGYAAGATISLKALSDGSFNEVFGNNISGTAHIRGSIIYEQA